MFDQSVSPVADPFDISSDICQCVRMGRVETVIIGNPPLIRDVLILIKKQTYPDSRADTFFFQLVCKAFHIRELGVTFDTIVDAVGSGGTFAGVCLANRLYGLNKRVVGINVCDDAPFFRQRVSEIVEEAGAYLEEPVAIRPEEVEIIDGYVGRGYALSRQEELNFIRDFARMEGVLLDPVYTGKCMYGFTQEVKKGSFAGSKNVLFLHTGGLFGLFPARELFTGLRKG